MSSVNHLFASSSEQVSESINTPLHSTDKITQKQLVIPIIARNEENKASSCPPSPLIGMQPAKALLRPMTPEFKPIPFINRRSPSSQRRSPNFSFKRDSPVPIEDPYQKGFQEGYKKAMEDASYREKREVKVTLRSTSPQLLQMLSTSQLQSLMEIKETLKKFALVNEVSETNASQNEPN